MTPRRSTLNLLWNVAFLAIWTTFAVRDSGSSWMVFDFVMMAWSISLIERELRRP